ncbi:MAG: response regulator [Pseudohongiellaceae bacterium]
MNQMEQWRGHILRRTLWTTSILASIAYIPGVIAAWKDELWLLILVNTLVWGLLTVVTLWRSLEFRVRAIVFISAWYLFSVFLMWLLGPVGVGILWVMAVPIFSALFFGYLGAWSGTLLLALFAVIYPFLPPSTVTENAVLFNLSYTREAWFAVSGSLLFLSSLTSLAIAELLARLEGLVEEQAASNQQLEALLEQESALQEALLISRKQSALGTLASGIAHDFNNFLLPIMMASEAARDHSVEGSEQQKALDTVISSAERAGNLIRRILRFSQNVTVEKKPMILQPVLDEAINLLRSSADKQVHIDYRNEVPDAYVLSDADSILQIIMNLGKNALLALPAESGRLLLEVRRNTGNPFIDIDVSDNGCGIPDSIKDRIFDPYFSTRSPETGTGLGLAIVHRLVTTVLDGRIVVSSSEGSGTTFTVSLPEITEVLPAGTDLPQSTVADSDSMAVPGKHILVVDDEQMVCATLEAILSMQNYRVKTCNSPDAALAFVRDNPNDIDIVMADKAMPGMSGLTLAEQLHQLNPDLKIIVMSGHLIEEDLATVRARGISGVIEKPFRRQQILDILKQL